MSDIAPEFQTVIFGARHLLEAGYIDEAEQLYKDLCASADSHGNVAEKKLAQFELVKFLRSRGRTEEADIMLIHSEKGMGIGSIENSHSPPRDIIVIGSGAGGVEAVCLLLNALPSDLNAAVLLVQQTRGIHPVN